MNDHVLWTPEELQWRDKNDPVYKMVIEGGLAVCKICGKFEAGLEHPCLKPCFNCVFRNDWDSQSKVPDCNLGNGLSTCHDYKTQEQYENESNKLPEWLIKEVRAQIDAIIGIHFGGRYSNQKTLKCNGWIEALGWVLSLRKPEVKE